jgi:hypothetical protein
VHFSSDGSQEEAAVAVVVTESVLIWDRAEVTMAARVIVHLLLTAARTMSVAAMEEETEAVVIESMT